MQYRLLGKTGIRVSRLCFGALTIGPLQANLPLRQGAGIIRKALEAGVNFIDTAELYRTYPYIKKAIKGIKNEVVIASKSYAYTYQAMKQSVEYALKQLARDYIDIFMLHETESILTIRGHREAVEYLLEAKEKGILRAIGISTHNVEGVTGGAAVPEIDVIHPLINIAGIGIKGGTAEDMLLAIKDAAGRGKGLYAMKALGGGNLLDRTKAAFDYIMSISDLASVAVGMSSNEEVEYNTRLFSGHQIPVALEAKLKRQPRRLHIEDSCQGCGKCVDRCSAGALKILGGRVVVDELICTLCGYCGTACPDFNIRVI